MAEQVRAEQVRAELQASVSGAERFLYRRIVPAGVRRVMMRRAGETAWRFTLRQGTVLSVVYFIWTSLLTVTLFAIAEAFRHGTAAGMAHRVGPFITISAAGALAVFAALILNCFKWTAVEEAGYFSRRSAAATLLGAVGLTAIAMCVLAACNFATGEAIFPITTGWFLLVGFLICGPCFEALTMLTLVERRRSDEWESLEIDEA